MNDNEILRDIPKIYEKITRCEKSILDLERNIMAEQQSIIELTAFIEKDKTLIASGKRPRYDIPSMEENIERHNSNIELFKKTIQTEQDTIKKFKDMLVILEQDLGKNPEHIFLYPK